MIRLVPVVIAVSIALLAGVAQAGSQATTLKIKADPSGALRYTTKSLAAKRGVVTIVMSNPAILPHNVAIKGKGVNVKGRIVGKGQTSKVTAKLKPGTYVFYCSVPGHEAAGMKGTLRVK